MLDPIGITVVVVLATLTLKGIHLSRKEKRKQWILQENRPEELVSSKLIMSEQYIHCTKPRHMRGTPDQVYQDKDKTLVLVGTKTRDKFVVYRKDIVQGSVYKTILEKNNKRVADYGYFRVVTPLGIKYIKKQLLTEAEVIEAHDQTSRILEGKCAPTPAAHRGMCKGCGQQENCDFWEYKDNKV